MWKNPDYLTARRLLIDTVTPVGTEHVLLENSPGRILAEEVRARADVPPFDRSAYDGYAFRAADVAKAGTDCPVTLQVLGEISAGAVSTLQVEPGTAVKILTGAPIPPGADAVIPYEKTQFTTQQVTIATPVIQGGNVVRRGEDVEKGQLLAQPGIQIDPGLAGTLASQGVTHPAVYRLPVIGLISTGNEVVEVGKPLGSSGIWDANRYTLSAALEKNGCQSRYLGWSGDAVEGIQQLLEEGLACCDAVLLTGGVSVGDYDLTPAAMERAGVDVLVRGVAMKPGMACAYGVRKGKLVCGLSGNPASCITNFYAVVLPALKKLAGWQTFEPEEMPIVLSSGFPKKSPATRFLRGKLDFSSGVVRMTLPQDQGNVVLSSSIGCNAMAVVPAGSGPIPAETELRGFLL
ncbi:MAG: gephyrin-like molybdotransferase Glp [Lawsonibacter sp.]